MGNLFLLNQSFELSSVPHNSRNKVIEDFCSALKCIKDYPDIIFATNDLYSYSFSYGNFFDLFYRSWPLFKEESSFGGISQTTHSLLVQIMFSKPALFREISSLRDFQTRFQNTHHGYSGLDVTASLLPYIKCKVSWNEWKINWFQKNQSEISWRDKHNFLPNKSYSDKILYQEVIIHSKENKIDQYNGNITNVFYEEIMKHKSHDRIAYIRSIGGKIALVNYYTHEKELSTKENIAFSRSYRVIYSVINSERQKQYLSLDFEKGMFELHNHKGKHLGEFRFDGTFNSSAKSSHDLKTLK